MIGDLVVRHTSKSFDFPLDLVRQGQSVIERWADVFPRENTWVQQEFGVPSLLTRIDCTVDNNQLRIFEVEDRPAGVGVSMLVSEEFADSLMTMKAGWPEFGVIVSPQRRMLDDHLWTKVLPCLNGTLVLVRAEPEEKEFHYLAPHSVSTVVEEGNKGYGLALGLWDEVGSPDELSFEAGFVLKPLHGSKSKNVMFWDPAKRPGCSTKSRVQRHLDEIGRMYRQPLYSPMPTNISEYPMMIFRVFYGLDMATRRWRYLGGLWNARPNLKIHGASNSLLGPLRTNS